MHRRRNGLRIKHHIGRARLVVVQPSIAPNPALKVVAPNHRIKRVGIRRPEPQYDSVLDIKRVGLNGLPKRGAGEHDRYGWQETHYSIDLMIPSSICMVFVPLGTRMSRSPE